jgi:GT2 family glycosyltransferase
MKKEEMVLTIVIINWNTRVDLVACLDSVEYVAKGVTAETIVVDNGSQDGSQDVVKKNYLWVSLIENKRNFGFAKAANDALRRMKGRYALLLNPDTQVKEGAIESLISFMDQHPEAGIVGVQLLNKDGSKQNSIANFPSLTTELLNKSLLRWLFPKRFPGKGRDYPEPIEIDSVIGACMMARRDAIDQVGLLDEDYFLFLEETDWCYRMKRAGWKIYHVPQAEIVHFQGKSAEQDKKRSKVEYYRSRYHFFRKNRGITPLVILFVGLVVRLVIEFLLTGVGSLLSFFAIKKWRRKLSVQLHLLAWHLRLCSEGSGLRMKE